MKMNAIDAYGLELRRRVWALVAEAYVDQRNTVDVSQTQVEARVDTEAAPA